MRLTKRGELVVLILVMVVCYSMLLVAYHIGQERKQDRIEQQWQQTD